MTSATSSREVERRYVPLHPDLYTFREEFLAPALVEALRAGTREALLAVVADSPVFGLFRFPCLRPAFCRRLIEELDHLERSGLVEMVRPNSMNRYGAVLDECGFRALADGLCARVIFPLADAFFSQAKKEKTSTPSAAAEDPQRVEPTGEGLGLKYHHAFTVRYAPMQDAKLAKHVDNADVTLNVCLGREGFKGGHLLFQGCKDSAVMRVPKKLHRFAAEEQEYRVRDGQSQLQVRYARHADRVPYLSCAG